MITVAVIDYGIGNIKSICRALEKSGAKTVITNERSTILAANGVVLPGVGAFTHGMEKINDLGIDSILRSYVELGKPILGVCLGMQLLFSRSTEFGQTKGLGLIPGQVDLLSRFDVMKDKLPHIGWSEISKIESLTWRDTILDGLTEQDEMYFVHSYHAKPDSTGDILSTTTYSQVEFCSTVKHENIYGCQYHPEKSAGAGLAIMKNFVEICRG